MRIRGIIEGFYGKPWSQEERLDLLRFAAAEGFNAWVHAPKDDPYHRRLWREPYPEAELERLAELAGEAERLGVDFAYAIAPGLDVCYSKEAEWEALLAKVEQVRGAGIRTFQLLWDDVEHTLNCPEDELLYGHEERPSAAAQAPFTNRFAREVEQPGPLVVCPIGYAGTGDSPYRKLFGERLDPDVVVYWTGPEVVSIGISREALDLAVERFRGHELLLWDNYPVNDFEPGTLFLGPLRGRDPRLAGGHCAGLIANAMVQAVPSKLALATIADWLRDPAGYDPDVSFERALRAYGDEVEEAVRRLGDEVDTAGALAQLGRA
ncbi:MAG: hyaluronoglucosaminidase [Gaiellaceae bacterium]|nr:hyaluronoglucosaminidase [Gaiellaceae bacterium]